jgi:peptide/nickel transport system substrate-binding protein
MARRTRARIAAAVAAAALTMTAAACSSSGSGGSTAASTGKYGGTLDVLMQETMSTANDSLEPASSNAQESEDMLPLIYSPLTVYVAGSNPTQIAGDLATNGGTASDDAKVWTFHIRKGIDYSYGQQVTSYDVKYDVERTFASMFAGGPGGTNLNLVGGSGYKGPYVDKAGLSSIQTPDPYTIVFNLAAPNYDFNYLTTYPCFSGVPQSKDTGGSYGKDPVTSGPYNIASYQVGKQLILTRNPKWKLSLVPAIKAYPDKIVYQMGLDPSVIDQRLITDTSTDQDAIDTDSSVQASDLAEVLNSPRVSSRESSVSLGANEWMLAMDVDKAPFNNQLVREAMQYAVNKQSFQTASGGPVGGGPIAHNLLGPGILGYQSSYDPYPAPATGNPAKAKALLTQAGYPNGVTVQLDMMSGSAQNNNQATAIENALNAAGFHVKLDMIPTDSFYTAITMPKTVPQAEVSLWGGAWNDGGQTLEMWDAAYLTPSGPNYDVSQLNEPSITSLFTKGFAEPSAQAAAPVWQQINEALMSNASVVPLINESKVYLHGSDVSGDIISDVYGAPTPFDISVQG